MNANIVEINVKKQTIIRSRLLYQWDSGQILKVMDQDIPDNTEIQFGNPCMREVIPAFFANNQVKIPHEIMEQPLDAVAYLVVVGENSKTTVKKILLPISPKPKPSAYVPEEEEQSILQVVQTKLDKSGWTPNRYLGTDNEGNVVEKEGGGGAAFTTDETLKLKNGVLSVNTADVAETDNTLPITSAAVATQVGNVEIILSTI